MDVFLEITPASSCGCAERLRCRTSSANRLRRGTGELSPSASRRGGDRTGETERSALLLPCNFRDGCKRSRTTSSARPLSCSICSGVTAAHLREPSALTDRDTFATYYLAQQQKKCVRYYVVYPVGNWLQTECRGYIKKKGAGRGRGQQMSFNVRFRCKRGVCL